MDKAQKRLSGTTTEPGPIGITGSADVMGSSPEPLASTGSADVMGSSLLPRDSIRSNPHTPDSDFKRYAGQAEQRRTEPAPRAQSPRQSRLINGSSGHNSAALPQPQSLPLQEQSHQPIGLVAGQIGDAGPLKTTGTGEPTETVKVLAQGSAASEGQEGKLDDANGRAHGVKGTKDEPVTGTSTSGFVSGEPIEALDHPAAAGASLLLPPSRIAFGQRIDKASLPIGYERRLRDKDHLRRVAELPCLVCSCQPSHAHHLRFAQRRGLGQKVSDEYVVPLCALHHGDLHRSSSEQEWWARQKINPVPVSNELGKQITKAVALIRIRRWRPAQYNRADMGGTSGGRGATKVNASIQLDLFESISHCGARGPHGTN